METHHAFVAFANALELADIPQAFKTQSVDVLHIVVPRVSIDDARELSRLALQKPFEGSMRTFVIITDDIAQEAQNALLKLLEEPPSHTQFFLVIAPTAFLLPTLRSRLFVLNSSRTSSGTQEAFTLFLSESYAQRLLRITEKTKAKDNLWIEDILRGCEQWVSINSQERRSILASLIMVRKHIGYKGASAKMLLEELALSLPNTS